MKPLFHHFTHLKHIRSIAIGTLFLSIILWLTTSLSSQGQMVHPRIWVTPEDRAEILDKIENHAYAAELFEQLKERADDAVARHQANRDGFLKALPLDWSRGPEAHPVFRTISTSDQSDRYIIMPYLQDAIDCGVVYYLTGEEAYAQCAADIMGVFISGLAQMEPGDNGGLFYPNGSSDHLLEARIIGAQIPVACDFIMPFVKEGGAVYDIVDGTERAFPLEEAQNVFKKYITMAIEVGHTGTNWSVLESPSLLCNILALDTEAEIEANLPYYLTVQSPRQDPLSTVAQSFPNPGDIWPESMHYSHGVASFSIYLMTVLDRLYPNLDLAQTYPNIVEAPSKDYLLQNPSGRFVNFGDSNGGYRIDYATFENAYLLAETAEMDRYTQMYGSLLKTAVFNGSYDRSTLPERNTKATIYKSPLKLLWSVPELEGEEKEYARPRTVELPFAGIYIQRNTNTQDPVENGLMAFVGGGHYVHGHASGMNMELYAKGHVIGLDAGKGTYGTDIHENYYRIFAAHNTVISNGASASSGGWVNLGIEQLELMRMEPMPEAAAVSQNHSFSTTRFHDIHNLVAPAVQERTLAVIRTSPTTGYYVDIYRARSDTPGQFHDYLYHNIGESLEFTEKPEGFGLAPDPDRFQASAELPWKQNSQFRHPGWHFFQDVETSPSTNAPVSARFSTSGLSSGTIFMDVYMNKGSDRSYTRAMAPPSLSSKAYADKPTPTLVVRQKGEAWSNPFAFVYSASSKEDSDTSNGVQSVDSLSEDGTFKGLVVSSRVDGKTIRQYILVLEEDDNVYRSADPAISFTGHFGVVTVDENGELISLYLGNGESLQYRDKRIEADADSGAAYRTFK